MRTDRLKTLQTVLEETNGRLQADDAAGARVWPSGFGSLDTALTGGFRSGELVLLGARPGLGKTTFALQVARNLVATKNSVVYTSDWMPNQPRARRGTAPASAPFANQCGRSPSRPSEAPRLANAGR